MNAIIQCKYSIYCEKEKGVTMRRIYVNTVVRYDSEGKVTPLWIEWTNGKRYKIDKILSVETNGSLRIGITGYRFQVRILGQERQLLFDGRRWHIEVTD